MNPLYSTPLHGVACEPFCDHKNHKIKQHVNISFNKLDLNNFNKPSQQTNKPNWVLEDNGERYRSLVSLTIKNQKTKSAIKNDLTQYLLKIDCQGKGVFNINKTNIDISWHNKGTDSAHYFQTIGLALWLEINNVLCIHANALAYQDQAVAFVAPSRTGKTTLTAELCKKDFSLMTDDMMALHKQDNGYLIYPSWPVARMWPETLDLIESKSNPEELSKVHELFAKKTININENSGFNFCSEPKKLKTIYILNRIEANTEANNNEDSTVCNITPLSSAQAVIILIQNSILGSAYQALNIEQQRFIKLTECVKNVKVKKITYVSGKQHLKKIKERIIKDLNE